MSDKPYTVHYKHLSCLASSKVTLTSSLSPPRAGRTLELYALKNDCIMKAFLTCAVSTLIATSFGAGVVQYDFNKITQQRQTSLDKRAGTIAASLENNETLYVVNVNIGTPPQSVQMQLGTGTSDVWVTNASAAYCQQHACQGIAYNPTESSSYDTLPTVFNITYVDGTGSSGIYFTDTLGIGDVSLKAVEMALANVTTIGNGIMGISFALDEAVCNVPGNCATYPTVLDQMVTQGQINSHAFSLWLNDLDASTGTVLFGGIDVNAYHPPLLPVPIERDSSSNIYSSFSVSFTGFTITSDGNINASFTPSNFNETVVLDSGTTLTYVPDSLFALIQAQFGIVNDTGLGLYVYDGTMNLDQTTLDFQFGGSSGPIIHAPMREFLVPLRSDNGSQAVSNGNLVYYFGILPGGNNYLLGDSFLRNAYVVYDLDNLVISLANTNFNSTTSNVIAIPAGSAGVAAITSTPTSTATSTATLHITSTATVLTTRSLYVSTIVAGSTTVPLSASVTGNGVTTASVVTTGHGPVSTAQSTSATASSKSGSSRTRGRFFGKAEAVTLVGTLGLFMLGFVYMM